MLGQRESSLEHNLVLYCAGNDETAGSGDNTGMGGGRTPEGSELAGILALGLRLRELADELKDRKFHDNYNVVTLQAVYDVGLAIASTLNLEELTEEILLRAVSLLDARRGAFYLRDAEGRLALAGTIGGGARDVLDVPPVAGSDGAALEEAAAGVIPAAEHSLAVPIEGDGGIGNVGLLVVADKESRTGIGPFAASDRRGAVPVRESGRHRIDQREPPSPGPREGAAGAGGGTRGRDSAQHPAVRHAERRVLRDGGLEPAFPPGRRRLLRLASAQGFAPGNGGCRCHRQGHAGRPPGLHPRLGAPSAGRRLPSRQRRRRSGDFGRAVRAPEQAHRRVERQQPLHHPDPGGEVDPQSRSVRYVNAGHNPGLLVRRSGEVTPLGASGLPLGLLPGSTYRVDEVEMAPGDLICLYSDGITECESVADEEYGQERLEAFLRERRDRPLSEMVRAIDDEVSRFGAGLPQGDDQTVVLIRRRAA